MYMNVSRLTPTASSLFPSSALSDVLEESTCAIHLHTRSVFFEHSQFYSGKYFFDLTNNLINSNTWKQ